MTRFRILMGAAMTGAALLALGCGGGGAQSDPKALRNSVDKWVELLSGDNVNQRVGAAVSLAGRSADELKRVLPQLEAALKEQTDKRVQKMLQYAVDKAQGKAVGDIPRLPPRR